MGALCFSRSRVASLPHRHLLPYTVVASPFSEQVQKKWIIVEGLSAQRQVNGLYDLDQMILEENHILLGALV